MRRDREGWNSDAMDRLCSCRTNVGDQPIINTSVIAQKLGCFQQKILREKKKKVSKLSGRLRKRLCGEGGRKCVDSPVCRKNEEVMSLNRDEGKERVQLDILAYYLGKRGDRAITLIV